VSARGRFGAGASAESGREMLSSRMSTLPLMRGMHLAAGGAATSAGRVSTSVVPATTVPLEGLIRSRHAAWQWTNTCSPQVGRRNFRHGRPVGQENSMEAVFAVSEDALQGATEKQRRYAETVAAKRGMQVPEHALSSREACSAFIDMLLASPADDAEVLETLAPTERQLQYARQLAKEYGMELSSEAVANRRACSEFIDRVPPSQKQVAFAKLLAERRGVPIPPHVLTQRKACSDFIDENKQESLSSTAARLPWAASPAMGPGPQPPVASSPRADFDVDLTDLIHRLAAAATPTRPSLYQLLTGVYMAQERGLALPQQALQDMRCVCARARVRTCIWTPYSLFPASKKHASIPSVMYPSIRAKGITSKSIYPKCSTPNNSQRAYLRTPDTTNTKHNTQSHVQLRRSNCSPAPHLCLYPFSLHLITRCCCPKL
jgi:hypothetical protein